MVRYRTPLNNCQISAAVLVFNTCACVNNLNGFLSATEVLKCLSPEATTQRFLQQPAMSLSKVCNSGEFCLLHWTEEGTYSIVSASKHKEPPPDANGQGKPCVVKGLERCKALIVGIGKCVCYLRCLV